MAHTLESARVYRNMSQKEAAKKIGVRANTLSRWEKGVTSPKMSEIQKLLKLYDMKIEEIIF